MTEKVKKRIEDINNGIVPEGYKKVGKDIIPIDWELCKLSEVSECLDNLRVPINSEERKLIPGYIPYYGAGDIQGYINKYLFDEDLVLLLEDGDAFDDYKIKSIAQFVTGKSWVNNHAHVLRANGDPYYLFISLEHKDIRNYTQLAGASRKKLVQSSMLNIPILTPPLEEQKKIGVLFRELDKAIGLYQNKIEELKNLKKAYLTKMFPQKGQKRPEIRFSGFTDDWEQRKLGELSKTTYGGGTPNTSNEQFWNGNIPWIQSSDITEHQVHNVVPVKHITHEGLSKSAAKLIPANSIAIVTRVGVGKLAVMPFEYTTSQDFLSLSDLNIDVEFAAYLLYKKMQSESNSVQGTSIKGVTKDELLKRMVMIPKYEEQQKIGSFFKNLDNTITLHQRKCELLKMKKKALMQLLLTGKVRVKV